MLVSWGLPCANRLVNLNNSTQRTWKTTNALTSFGISQDKVTQTVNRFSFLQYAAVEYIYFNEKLKGSRK